MTYIVLCAGGHARVVCEALRCAGSSVVGLTDRNPALHGQQVGGVVVIGSDDMVAGRDRGTTLLANGCGNTVSDAGAGLGTRRKLFTRFKELGFTFPVVRHPGAIVAADVALDEGVQVMAGAVVQPAAWIGQNTIINSRALVEHDCVIGPHAHIAPGALLCGGVRVGSETHVGAGAVILQNIVIGDGVVIAAGSIVTRDVPSETRVVGDQRSPSSPTSR